MLQIHSKNTTLFLGLSTETIHLFNVYSKKNIACLGIYDNKDHSLIVGDIQTGIRLIFEKDIQKIICSDKRVDKKELNDIIQFCDENGIELLIIPDENSYLSTRFVPVSIKNIIALQLVKKPLNIKKNQQIKRIFDMLFSILITVFVLSWFIPIVAILIKLSSKGPILFIQKRNGLNNKEFNCLKFRTMIINESSDTVQAKEGDQRITKIGAFLRKTSLDELPQFFNVIKGDMSVIGPRPHMIKHNEDYSKLIKEYNYRTKVKPGITGLSQVLGYRGETESDIYLMKIRVRIDRFYIQNWSFGLDMKILLKTIKEVIRRPKKAC